MTWPLLLAALFPALYWEQPVPAAEALRQAGVQRICVPASVVEAWRAAGFAAEPFNPEAYRKTTPPGVEWRVNEAAATQLPWIDANGWRFLREHGGRWDYQPQRGRAALAAAEAWAYGVDAVVRAAPEDLSAFGAMLAFLRQMDRPRMPVLANIGVIDDGSEQTAEVLDLLSRRNLLFRVLRSRDPHLDLNLRMPAAGAADPYEFAGEVRRKLTDEKRLVRLFGSEVVLAHLTGEGGRARLYLLNYSGRRVSGLRVRVRGNYSRVALAVFSVPDAAPADWTAGDGAVEFTIPEMQTCAVADLLTVK